MRLLSRSNFQGARLIAVFHCHAPYGLVSLYQRGLRGFIIYRELTLILVIGTLLRHLLRLANKGLLPILVLGTFERRVLREVSPRVNFSVFTIRGA